MGRVLYVFIALSLCYLQAGAQNADAAKTDTVKKKKGQSFEELKRDLAKGNPLYLLNGEDIKDSVSKENFDKLKSEDITSIDVIKDKGATEIWGKRGAGGVVIVHTKDEAKDMEAMMREAETRMNAPLAHSMSGAISEINRNFPLFVVDGRLLPDSLVNSEAKISKAIERDNVFSSSMLKYSEGTARYGSKAANGVVVVTTINYAVKQYQDKLARFSKGYDDYVKAKKRDDSNLNYVVDGKQLAGEKIEIVRTLYKLPVKKIKSVTFRDLNKPAGNIAPTLTINTK